MQRARRGVLLMLVLGLSISSAQAHHSLASFDSSQTVSLSGTVREWRWVNPHVRIMLDVGDQQLWSVEMNPPNMLLESGWTPNTLAVGDKVTVFGNPLRTGAQAQQGRNRLNYLGIILPLGQRLGTTGAR